MEEERFALDNNNYIIDFDESCKTYCLTQEQVCEILNQQDQRIAELEEQLKNITNQVRMEILQKVEKRIINYCRRQSKKQFKKSIEGIEVDLLTSINQIYGEKNE